MDSNNNFFNQYTSNDDNENKNKIYVDIEYDYDDNLNYNPDPSKPEKANFSAPPNKHKIIIEKDKTDKDFLNSPCASNSYNKKGHYFSGQGETLVNGLGSKAYFLVSNPKDSEINILLNTCYHSNLSNNAVKINIYYSAKIKGDFKKSCNIACNNQSENNIAKAQIFSDNDIKFLDGICTYTLAVPPFSTFKDCLNDSAILVPGEIYIVEVSPLCPGQAGMCISSFAWWEEPIKKCK